jgi:type IV pilus assembly protein PilV
MRGLHFKPIHPYQSGVSLIEVLVSILVAALGIMTMVVMQVNATKLSKTSEVRAMGALLVGDLADRMRANPQGFTTNSYAFNEASAIPAASTQCVGATANCLPPQMAQQDLSDWLNTIQGTLPSGTARISTVNAANNGVDLWLIWIDPQDQSTATASNLNPSTCPKDLSIKSDTAPVRCMYFRINI